ncbi:MAG: UDP-N-acetylmuramoyl-L-alanine--D-glutamate ligase [Verrucomicrobiota bacterium]|nr:UDP-N-acetylmuramoyl-L-alanine--D-glutamate ligase [Verrucomicrobiota bacterium]
MKPDLKNYNIVVLGAGRSGCAAARFLLSKGARVTIQDEGTIRDAQDLVRAGCQVQSGGAIDFEGRFDLAVVSPGIDPRKLWIQSLIKRNIPIWSELELAWQFCECPIIAITGTNGKTTTTELLESVFRTAGKKTVASGNIGLPFTEAIAESGSLDVMVIEVSSFQLEQIKGFRPVTSVYLNLSPDHLDRYDSMEDYRAAKNRIFENQRADDSAVVNADFHCDEITARKITFSTTQKNADYTFDAGMIFKSGEPYFDTGRSLLRGVHNAENIMATLAVAAEWGLPFEKVTEAICAYQPAPHRCELVAVINGVSFINDSKATNIDALGKALLSQSGKVILIAGGKDKGFSFDSLAPLIAQKVKKAFLIGETAGKIAGSWMVSTEIEDCGDLATATRKASAMASAGDVVLFSPACSSFDQFKNYEDRGNQFKNFVLPQQGYDEANNKTTRSPLGVNQEIKII